MNDVRSPLEGWGIVLFPSQKENGPHISKTGVTNLIGQARGMCRWMASAAAPLYYIPWRNWIPLAKLANEEVNGAKPSAVVIFLGCLLSLPLWAQARRPMTFNDMMKMRRLATSPFRRTAIG